MLVEMWHLEDNNSISVRIWFFCGKISNILVSIVSLCVPTARKWYLLSSYLGGNFLASSLPPPPTLPLLDVVMTPSVICSSMYRYSNMMGTSNRQYTRVSTRPILPIWNKNWTLYVKSLNKSHICLCSRKILWRNCIINTVDQTPNRNLEGASNNVSCECNSWISYERCNLISPKPIYISHLFFKNLKRKINESNSPGLQKLQDQLTQS